MFTTWWTICVYLQMCCAGHQTCVERIIPNNLYLILAEGNVQSKCTARRINELLWQEIPTAILILIRLQEMERIKTHQLYWQEVLNYMASSCCQKMCLPALLRSPVFWCDQNFTPKCYRLTSLHNCMLSLYKGKENDILLKAYHYYEKNHHSTIKVWNAF